MKMVSSLEWSCEKSENGIMVWYGPYFKGNYSLLEEPYCRICGHADVETELCTSHYDLDGFDRIYAMGKYLSDTENNDLLTHHIRTLKKFASHAVPLGLSMQITVKELFPELLNSTVLVPIPIHTDKLVKRGFNQSLELCKVIGDGFKVPVQNVLVKTEDIDLRRLEGRSARWLAVERMYSMNQYLSEEVKGQNVLLIDDVVTTGFTSSKCARLLKEFGAKSINVLTAGRTS